MYIVTMNFEDLIDLDVTSKFDVSSIQKGTQNAMQSHLNLLRRNRVELSRNFVETLEINELLDGLKNTRDEKLSPVYKV